MKRKRKRNELKPEIVAVLHTVKNYNIIEPPLCETRKQDRIKEFSDNKIRNELFTKKIEINGRKNHYKN